jgi:hypothetical protein
MQEKEDAGEVYLSRCANDQAVSRVLERCSRFLVDTKVAFSNGAGADGTGFVKFYY